MLALKFSRTAIICLLLGAAFPLGPTHTFAQDRRTEAPPYEPDLMRLSEIMGALHFLRPLCGETDEPNWRTRMESLLVAETRDENRRRRFIERFNQGYRGFAAVYRTCTSSARTAMGHYILEGEEIINQVSSRYGR
ncbi:TIGR02301 family protein [Roseibium aquae]|uniref:TIGR02301 family protein n=1 Tax=Roseibium aquae TaxID=1323746 RepID=A0A916TKG4_9HYPH|nr:TIGR02301 family protein [Roseibium aquae]GGB51716.1 TIGR02301 family protein [Roseibium aquae]